MNKKSRSCVSNQTWKYSDGLNTKWGRVKANKEKRERGEKVLKKGSLEDAVEAVWLKGKKGTLLKDPVEGFVYARNTTGKNQHGLIFLDLIYVCLYFLKLKIMGLEFKSCSTHLER